MSNADGPDPNEVFERIIDGTPIVTTAQKMGARFIGSAFEVFEAQIKEAIAKNIPDSELSKDIDALTKDLIDQFRKRMNQLFPDADG